MLNYMKRTLIKMINFNKTALVLIDLQQGILKMDYAPNTAENVIQNANKLIEVFRKIMALSLLSALNFTMVTMH